MEWKRKILNIRKRQPTGITNQEGQTADNPSSRDGQTSVTEDTFSIKQNDEWSSNLPHGQPQASKGESTNENSVETPEDIDEYSPYEEIRAAVRNTDDNSPANTVRAWVLGIFFVNVVAAINMLLSMRSPPLTVPTVV